MLRQKSLNYSVPLFCKTRCFFQYLIEALAIFCINILYPYKGKQRIHLWPMPNHLRCEAN